ncbi:MAG TPA: hypothetical protein VLM41_03500 [Steroidobacteraceae bacterium]|nr:hypothetical protein [Steroidobacteraceae bacterium]
MPTDSSAMRFRCVLAFAALLIAPLALADVVQGVVTPGGAEVVIRDAGGKEVARVAAGPFQVWLPTGSYEAECLTAGKGRKIKVRSLSQPTSVKIDCR